MKKHTRSLLIAIVSTLICLAAYVGTILNKDGMIIRYHYSGWRTINTISSIVLAISGVNLVLNLIYSGYKYRQKQKDARSEQEQAAQREAELNESKKLSTPEEVRQYFIKICKAKPHSQIAKMIKDQLDEMNEHQDRFEKLLEVNDISSASNIREVLQDAEDSICADCKSVINRFIVGDDTGFEETAELVHKRNAAKLEKVKEFLAELAAFASGKITGGDAINNLEIYAETIRESMNEEAF